MASTATAAPTTATAAMYRIDHFHQSSHGAKSAGIQLVDNVVHLPFPGEGQHSAGFTALPLAPSCTIIAVSAFAPLSIRGGRAVAPLGGGGSKDSLPV